MMPPELKRSRNSMLAVLTVILAFNHVDRLALGLMMQDVKQDLMLSDTQLGLLTGIAFALFYSIMGLPIARWVDRGNRVTIISVTTGLWSAAVALCGSAASFIQLLLIRITVAVGEAGCIPAAQSLIADYFQRSERPRAVAIYMMGGPLSAVVGYFIAGWLNEFFGWRMTFVLLGLPGLLLGIIAWFVLAEPRKTKSIEDNSSISEATPSLREVCQRLLVNKTFCHLVVVFALMYFFGYGLSQWTPAFFVRSHGLSTGELGTWFTLIHGVGGLIGTYLGGELAFRYAANNERLQLRAMTIACAIFGIVSAGAYLAASPYVAFALKAVAAVGGAATNAPMFAMLQTAVQPRMRGTAVALIFLFANLIGMGLGPLAAGLMSDGLRPLFGEESLRYGLLMLCPGYLWAGWHLWLASRTVVQDLER